MKVRKFSPQVALAVLALFTTVVHGAENVGAIADFAAVKSKLAFQREGEAIDLQSYSIPLVFVDPSGSGQIERLLLDPGYMASKRKKTDFLVHTSVREVHGSETLTAIALCSWNRSKTLATCSVEGGGGQYQVIVRSRRTTLKASRFVLRVARLGGYEGFYLGRSSNEPDAAISVAPRKQRPVDVRIGF